MIFGRGSGDLDRFGRWVEICTLSHAHARDSSLDAKTSIRHEYRSRSVLAFAAEGGFFVWR